MADDAEISAFLRGLGPQGGPDTPMPEEVWNRLQGVLAAESAARIATSGAPEQPAAHLGRTAPNHRRHRSSYGRRWATGLVAASAVVLGGVVLAGVLRQDESPIVADASVLSTPKAMAGAGVLSPSSIVAPAQHITNSKTDYSLAGFPDQVDDLLAGTDMEQAADSRAQVEPVPVEVSPLLEAPLFKLRDCVTNVLDSEQRSALIVDLSTFDGEPVGILLTPTSQPGLMEASVVDTHCHLAFRSFVTVP